MFAELGSIRFLVVGSPETFTAAREYRYAELDVVEARPLLQWLADGLEQVELELMFHASFTNPAAQVRALHAAAETHQALPLVFGNGDFRGYFVIEKISTAAEVLAADGTVLALTASVSLKEFVADSALSALATPIPLFAPLAVVNSMPAPATSSSTPSVVQPLSPSGLSPILNLVQPSGALAPSLQPGDVPTPVITRSESR